MSTLSPLANLSSALARVAALVNRGPSLLDECLALIAGCQTMADCDRVSSDMRAVGSVRNALSAADKEIVKIAGQTRRAMITMNAIPGPVSLVAPVSVVASVTQDLTRIATESTTNAASVNRRGTQVRSLSPERVAEATRVARLAGAVLAGYDGRIVEPGTTGLGTIIAFGNAITEYDAVADRMRQTLVAWSDVESVRVACGLPVKAFGRAPGLVGLLGKATQILNHGGYVARNVKTAGKYATAWKIGFFDNRMDSDSLGQKEALITLGHDDVVTCDNPDHPGAVAVLADYNRRVAGTLIASDDLATRIEACLRNHYGARSTDMGVYIAPFHQKRAMDLVVALRPIAGRKIRAWAHTDAASISDALVDSFSADLQRLERDIESKSEDLKRIAGASLIERCERMRAECDGLSAILGADAVSGFKARILACDAKITEGMNATVQRAMMIELT